ncbi:MAG: sulfur carrier protein ThiS [Planctomycetota bacterium]
MGDVASTELQVTVNGEPRRIVRGATVADLVRELGLQPQQVAVERNKDIVRRADHATVVLGEGDRLEVVTFFGGG